MEQSSLSMAQLFEENLLIISSLAKQKLPIPMELRIEEIYTLDKKVDLAYLTPCLKTTKANGLKTGSKERAS